MKKDPRYKNTVFAGARPRDYLANYVSALNDALKSVSTVSLEAAYAAMTEVLRRQGTIYVAGNGGSASISDHLCCDWSKGTRVEGRASLRLHSLSANVALVSALANDYGYEYVFSAQVEMFARPEDLLILISSSGNSPNIINAAKKAKEMNIKTMGLSGFSGGALSEIVDVNLFVQFSNYGVVEDSHQILMHVLAQHLSATRDQANSTI